VFLLCKKINTIILGPQDPRPRIVWSVVTPLVFVCKNVYWHNVGRPRSGKADAGGIYAVSPLYTAARLPPVIAAIKTRHYDVSGYPASCIVLCLALCLFLSLFLSVRGIYGGDVGQGAMTVESTGPWSFPGVTVHAAPAL